MVWLTYDHQQLINAFMSIRAWPGPSHYRPTHTAHVRAQTYITDKHVFVECEFVFINVRSPRTHTHTHIHKEDDTQQHTLKFDQKSTNALCVSDLCSRNPFVKRLIMSRTTSITER